MNRMDYWLNEGARMNAWLDTSIQNDYGRIWLDKPVDIVILRDGVQLAAQTICVQSIDNVPFERIAAGKSAFVNGSRVRLYGYKDHPTIADTNIQFGDRFSLEGQIYEVIQIQPGEVWFFSAIAEARD